MEAPHARSEPTLSSVEAFRASARANGYTPIPVRTRSKQPVGKDWPSGGKLERLVNIVKEELNTGILAAGLRCIDVDVDEPQIAAAIKKKILARFPDAIFRGRANTSRFAAGLRAAEGEPGKRSMAGPLGKIEILGAGQQFVAHGVHQSGAAIEWENGRGPDTIPRNQLPAVTEEQINELLNECAPLLGSSNAASAPGTVNKLFEEQSAPLSTHFSSTAPDANDLSAGIEILEWFDHLDPEEKSSLARACLAAIDNRTVDPREQWLRILFAMADAGRRGCPEARELAMEWSRRGRGWTGAADFDKAWDSYKPGAITIGSLLKTARDAGLNLSPWRDLALTPSKPMSLATPSAVLVDPFGHLTVDPDNIPPHRQWSVGTKLVKGEVAILAAKGGWGKSAYTTALLLVVHHTRKDGDLTNVDAIGGASAIVNQARVALMLVRMTAEESKNFKGILPSEVWRYFRIVDAKTNLAPPGASTQWYQLVSHELPNAELPTYSKGDGVQVVDKLDPAKLSASPLGNAADDIAKRAILKAASSADPPFSPSGRGGSERYIVRQVLGTVRQATGKHLADRDLIKHVEILVKEMTALGWLYVADDAKVAGNKRKGVMVNWAVTPWAHNTSPEQVAAFTSRQISQKGFETIRRNGTGGIDAPRPTGASNVPKRYGDLTRQVFDAAPTDSEPPACPPTEPPVNVSEDRSEGQLMADCGGVLSEPPGSKRANTTVLDELLAQNADRLGIPDVLLRRGRLPASLPATTAAAAPPFAVTPSHPETPAPTSTDVGDDLAIPPFLRRP